MEVFHRGVNRKSKIEYGDFKQIQKDSLDGKEINDNISFIDMLTPFVLRGDDITFDGIQYNVEHFMKVGDGIYKVYAKKTARIGSSKTVKVTM